MCQGKFVDECGGPNGTADADGCVWQLLLWYGGIEAYEASHALDEATMVGRVEGATRAGQLPAQTQRPQCRGT